ncbi:MAG: glutathione S-transferase family protein [Burkholderiales bacterium]
MKLWYSPPSPFARKVRAAAIELALAERIELVLTPVVPIDPNPALIAQNPLVKLPTLEAEDGTVLYDSRTICEYLDALAGGGRLFPAPGPARWDALRRQALGDGIMDAGILRRYELVLRPEALRWDDWLRGQQAKIDFALDAAQAEAGRWGEAFDIGHLTIACALGWLDFRFAGFDWRKTRAALATWHESVAHRPSLAQTVPTP